MLCKCVSVRGDFERVLLVGECLSSLFFKSFSNGRQHHEERFRLSTECAQRWEKSFSFSLLLVDLSCSFGSIRLVIFTDCVDKTQNSDETSWGEKQKFFPTMFDWFQFFLNETDSENVANVQSAEERRAMLVRLSRQTNLNLLTRHFDGSSISPEKKVARR